MLPPFASIPASLTSAKHCTLPDAPNECIFYWACSRTNLAWLKGIVAIINLHDIEDGIREPERAARLGLSGAMITVYPLEHRRYCKSEHISTDTRARLARIPGSRWRPP
jgi:hypothetical protein